MADKTLSGRSYEGLFIFPPENGPESKKSYNERVEGLFKKFKASIAEKNEMGKRNLGYPLKKFSEGEVLLYRFQLDPLKMDDLRKALDLDDLILKYMITLSTEPSKKKVKKSPAKASKPQPPRKSQEVTA